LRPAIITRSPAFAKVKHGASFKRELENRTAGGRR